MPETGKGIFRLSRRWEIHPVYRFLLSGALGLAMAGLLAASATAAPLGLPSIPPDIFSALLQVDYDATSDDLKYATNASGAWTTKTVDSAGSVGQWIATAAFGLIASCLPLTES